METKNRTPWKAVHGIAWFGGKLLPIAIPTEYFLFKNLGCAKQ